MVRVTWIKEIKSVFQKNIWNFAHAVKTLSLTQNWFELARCESALNKQGVSCTCPKASPTRPPNIAVVL